MTDAAFAYKLFAMQWITPSEKDSNIATFEKNLWDARFDYPLGLPESADVGGKINETMREIEKHNPLLAGVLPKTYNLFNLLLPRLVSGQIELT